MTRKTYIATIDSYIPLASAWADQQWRKKDGHLRRRDNGWIRHFAFAMDEARRRMGKRMSYDLCPRLLKPPVNKAGKYTDYELARWLTECKTGAELRAKRNILDIRPALQRFGASTWEEAKRAAERWSAENPLDEYMSGYKRELSAHFDGQTLDKVG